MGQSNFYSIDKTTKKIRVMLLGIFFFTFLTFLPQARASHALGAELTYTCLGNNDYRITYNFFRDCGGISMGSTVSLNYQSSCGSSSITLTRESIEDITQTCGTGTSECQGGSIPGVEKHVFRGTLNLPSNSCIYTISVSVNARNSVITTLNNPGSQSLYIEALIYNNASICNNSPVFLNPASASGCVGQVVNYNHGVTDPDGDQLVFSLGNCYEGPGNPVNYNAGYSGTSPLATSGGVSINPNTGAITFTPSFIQVGVLCVIVKEYRNNVQIGQVVRDIQFNIGNCGANSAPTASGPYLYNATPGQQLCFNINGSDPNAGDKVKMSTNNGISGGSFSPSLPTGFVTNPSTQFCWTPQLSDQNQTHFFTISVQDDNCPVAASNTFTYQVTVGAACNGPMASCKNKIVYLNSNGVATISTSDIDNNSTYDCGLASMVLNNNTFGCNNIGNNNTVTLTVTDDEGATSQCTATVTVVDNSKPVPNVTNLPTVTGQCSASVTPPTATDNCAGTVTGTTNSPTTYNTQGTFYITWSYNDGNGNIETQVQTVIVDDTTMPVPNVANLPTITGQCGASVTPPTATDNCAGTIVGTTNSPTTYNTQGTYNITWTYNDGNGNSKTQVQTVIVDDTMKPVPTVSNLPTVTGQCSASVTPPKANDNCAGMIVGTTNSPTTYNAQGTFYITWSYNDGNGNIETQVQTVIVDDTMKPVPTVANLPTITGQCGASVTAPKANDNCAGMIVGTTNSPTTYNAQGTFYITWSYNDGNGNIETQVQTVIVDDTTMPVPNVANLPTITGQCGASVTPPKANDNCAGMIVGTTNSPTTYNTQGTYNITWTYNDGNGNSKTQVQTVIVEDITKPEISCPTSPITVSNAAGQCGANVPFNVSATDNCGDVTVVCTIGGDNGGGSGNCATNNLNLSLTFDNYPQETSWMILQLPQEIMVASGGTYGSEPDGSTLNIPINLPDGEYLFLIKDSAGDGMCCTYGSGSYALSSNGQTFAQGGSFSSFEKTPFCVETPAPGGGPLTEVSSGDFFPVGTTTVTCTATDAAGLTDVCTFDIIVNDTQAPWLTSPCPGNITLCGAQNVSWTPPAADDNCGVVASTNNYDPDDFFEVGTYNVVYTFYDAAGLSVSCSFTITINPVPQVTISQTNLPTWCQGIKVLTANVLNPQALTYPLTFAWSDGLGDSPTVIAPANGTYSVVVTDALGCSTEVSTTVNVDISTLLSAYTIISGQEFEMYESDVIGGGVGIKDADEAEVSQNSSILTFMKANAAGVTVDGSSFVNNFINADWNLPYPQFRSNPFNDLNNVNVPANMTMTLSGSHYGYITVGTGATLIMTSPEVFVKNLVTSKNATIIFNQPTEMMIRKKMTIGQTNTVNPDGYTSVIYVADVAQVGQGSNVTLSIYAPEGLDVSDSGATLTTYMTGIFISNDRVVSDHNVVWNWNLNCSFINTGAPTNPNFAESIDPGQVESNLSPKEGLNIYPNPTAGILQVDVSNYVGKSISIAIYDQLGREVWNYQKEELVESVIKVDMTSGGYVNSIYLLNLQSEGQSESAIFVLSK